jgi:hypothetical protein
MSRALERLEVTLSVVLLRTAIGTLSAWARLRKRR